MPRKSGLLEIAERQQAALAAEAKALGLSLRMEVRPAMTDGLTTAATDGVQAVQTATEPLLGKLACWQHPCEFLRLGRSDAVRAGSGGQLTTTKPLS